LANIDKKNIRYNILIIIVYIIGMILLFQLFNLQIIHGAEYYEKSSTRLTRETTIEAARGNILDRNGNIIAGTITKYTLEIYRSKIETDVLNNTILSVINILEKNGDKYNDTFPIRINPIEFVYEENRMQEWKENNNLSKDLSAEEILEKYKLKYEITSENIEDVRKIIAIRYGIEKNGYSTMRAYVISDSVSEESVAVLEEQNNDFPGISISVTGVREYTMESLASHVIRIYRVNK
jgi:penicillin-binding protein 2